MAVYTGSVMTTPLFVATIKSELLVWIVFLILVEACWVVAGQVVVKAIEALFVQPVSIRKLTTIVTCTTIMG